MIRKLGSKKPEIHPTAFVSEFAYVIGDVYIGENSSIWPGTIIRADQGKITIGSNTNIQDNSVVHGDADLIIEDNVTIGHRVMCHAAFVGAFSLIGNGAILNDGVRVGNNSIIASGPMVLENMEIPQRSVVRGMPARIRGEVNDKHISMQMHISKVYVDKSNKYKSQGDLE